MISKLPAVEVASTKLNPLGSMNVIGPDIASWNSSLIVELTNPVSISWESVDVSGSVIPSPAMIPLTRPFVNELAAVASGIIIPLFTCEDIKSNFIFSVFPSAISPNGVCKSSKNLTLGISTVKVRPVASLIPPSYPPSPEIVVLIEKADMSTFPNGESDPSSVSFCSKF